MARNDHNQSSDDLLEKLVTDRTGEKGDRDLLVALGLLVTCGPADLDEFEGQYRRQRPDLRHTVQSNLTLLSLIEPRTGMPDPRPQRAAVRCTGADEGRSSTSSLSAPKAISPAAGTQPMALRRRESDDEMDCGNCGPGGVACRLHQG